MPLSKPTRLSPTCENSLTLECWVLDVLCLEWILATFKDIRKNSGLYGDKCLLPSAHGDPVMLGSGPHITLCGSCLLNCLSPSDLANLGTFWPMLENDSVPTAC